MITLSLIIPMYNEEQRIQKCIRALRAFKPPREVEFDRVIFVSDGSTDRTVSILKNAHIPYQKTILSYKKNQGRGYALRTGMKKATGDYALWLDVDMSTPLTEIYNFLPYIKQNEHVIVGSRKTKGSRVTVRQPLYRIILGQGFSFLSKTILNVPVNDFTCGFKAFSKEAYTSIFPLTHIDRWGNDSESLFIAKKFGFSIIETPIHWINDPNTKVRVAQDILRGFFDLGIIHYYNLMGYYETTKKYSRSLFEHLRLAYETN